MNWLTSPMQLLFVCYCHCCLPEHNIKVETQVILFPPYVHIKFYQILRYILNNFSVEAKFSFRFTYVYIIIDRKYVQFETVIICYLDQLLIYFRIRFAFSETIKTTDNILMFSLKLHMMLDILNCQLICFNIYNRVHFCKVIKTRETILHSMSNKLTSTGYFL